MDLSKIVSGVLDVAEKLAPALEGTPVEAVVKAGQSVLALIESVRDVASTDDAAMLEAKREQLEPLVMKHLDDTISSLD
jgi:hypothetical protein